MGLIPLKMTEQMILHDGDGDEGGSTKTHCSSTEELIRDCPVCVMDGERRETTPIDTNTK
jgi:hypothetical protein